MLNLIFLFKLKFISWVFIFIIFSYNSKVKESELMKYKTAEMFEFEQKDIGFVFSLELFIKIV